MNFKANLKLERELAKELRLSGALLAQAEQVKRHAEANARQVKAPWLPRRGHDPIEIERTLNGFAVVNTDHLGHLQEWGSIRNPPHGVLRRAVRQAGLKFRPLPK